MAEQIQLVFRVRAGPLHAVRILVGDGGGQDLLLLLGGKGRVQELAVHPLPQGGSTPVHGHPLRVDHLCFQTIFAQQERLLIFFVHIQNNPFDGLLTVGQVLVLLVVAEGELTANFGQRFRRRSAYAQQERRAQNQG